MWVILGLVVLVSHYSHRFAKLLGNNPVSVLATLILLSYTKILRSLIAVVYVTYLEYPEYNNAVWLYDANINYLSGKHIPLFIGAVLVFLFLFLPYWCGLGEDGSSLLLRVHNVHVCYFSAHHGPFSSDLDQLISFSEHGSKPRMDETKLQYILHLLIVHRPTAISSHNYLHNNAEAAN